MNFLSQLPLNQRAWQLLAVSALCFELIALYFQYVMGLEPCIMCIYQRTAIWAIFLAGVVGALGCQFILMRIVAYGLWATGAVWGLMLALEHVDMQSTTIFQTSQLGHHYINGYRLYLKQLVIVVILNGNF